MAHKKLKKYPKKPKQSASLQVMENYLKRRAEIDRENNRIKSDEAKRKRLKERISGLEIRR